MFMFRPVNILNLITSSIANDHKLYSLDGAHTALPIRHGQNLLAKSSPSQSIWKAWMWIL